MFAKLFGIVKVAASVAGFILSCFKAIVAVFEQANPDDFKPSFA